ncbi:MAG: 6-phosphogluconolactonase, partial [Candidatus Omnitrophica bacterium]|nr:6-phosphogluconolactonase [Candidatus Omnitrophota bacterium]
MSKETSKLRLRLAKNYEELCQDVVRNILALSEKIIALRGRFAIALSGGSTPKGIYALMASPDYRNRFQWEKIHFFWGDERWVSPEDVKSNYRMVAEALLTRVDIPPGNIHPIRTDHENPEISAAFYEKELVSSFNLKNGEWPHFDLILLGLGNDGHVASLFPGSPELLLTNRLAVPVVGEKIEPSRVTVTLPLINQAEFIFLLISGREKAEILKAVLEGAGNNSLPVQKVNPQDGEVLWFTDQSAA